MIDGSRRVLELGAGSGLLGIALLKSSSHMPSYTFTDYSPMILNLLRQNILLNFSEDQLDVPILSHPASRSIVVVESDSYRSVGLERGSIVFSTGLVQLSPRHGYGYFSRPSSTLRFFLSSDVVYDPSIIDDLVQTIEAVMKTNPHCIAYLANTIRNPSTYEQFRTRLNRSSMTIDSIVLDENQSIELLRISQRFDKF